MSNPSYIAAHQDDLFDQAPEEIQALILDGEVNKTTAILGKLYQIPVSSYVALSNIISFILIGALKPGDAVRGIMDILELPEEVAIKLATDMDKTILERARISILGKSPKDMVTLTFQEGRSPDELRKEILDTTKREPVLPPTPSQTSPSVAPVKSVPVAPTKPIVVAGSRSQLLEQLQVLDDIPNDEEVTERLKKIQEQISGMSVKDDRALDSTVALQEFMPGNNENLTVEPEVQAASYSKAPTKYNVDPYREVTE